MRKGKRGKEKEEKRRKKRKRKTYKEVAETEKERQWFIKYSYSASFSVGYPEKLRQPKAWRVYLGSKHISLILEVC